MHTQDPLTDPDGLEGLVQEWLTLPALAERLDTDIIRVRQMLRDHLLIAVRRGERNVLSVPAELLPQGHLLPDLQGTLTVLRDAGFSDVEALRWLLTPDDTLPGTPAQAMAAGRKTEIRRRAQALAF